MKTLTFSQVENIQSAFEKIPKSGSISVMPDFFVDRLVRIESLDELFTAMRSKSVKSGGGSIRGVSQAEVKGGNAVNLAYSLGKFGASVNLVAIADSLPSEMLRSTFKPLGCVNLLIVEGSAGFTIAFEFKDKDRHANVMVSDVGDLKNFDGSEISSEYWDKICQSKIVSVVNWSANRSGNALCERVFSHAKEKGAKTFFDPADISGQEDRIPEFRRKIIDARLADVISLNDNEARILSMTLINEKLSQDYSVDELKQIVLKLSNETGVRIDLHTKRTSLSCQGNDIAVANCFQVVQKTITGAGDVWAAGDVIGYLTGLEPTDRLSLANAAAGLYVSKDSATPPTTGEVLEFMTSMNNGY